MKLSSRVQAMSDSITLKLNAQAVKLSEEGKKVYNLTSGQLPFLPMPELIAKINHEAKFLKSYQYSPVPGFPDLRKKFLNYFFQSRNIPIDPNFDAVISNGGKHAITNVVGALVEEGDEVLLLAPYWISYPEIVRLWGATPVIIDSSFFNNFTPSIDEIRNKITDKTRLLIINSPNNPAGIHYSKEWMQSLGQLLRSHPQIAILSDEIYYELSYYDPGPTYFYQDCPDLLSRTVVVDGISKSMAGTGLRLGYCLGDKKVISQVGKMQAQTTSGANSLIQRAVAELDFSLIKNFVAPVNHHLRANSQIVRSKLQEYDLSRCWYQTFSAFYFFLDMTLTPYYEKISQHNNAGEVDYSNQICSELLDNYGLALVPGSDFGMSNTARFSLVLPEKEFTAAMDLLMKVLIGRV